MAIENKKQLLIIVGAVVTGILATVMTSTYVQNKISSETAALAEQYGAKQKEVVAQIQQRSEQQMAALAQEINRVKTEQAEAMKQQMAALQQAQAQQAQAAAVAAAAKSQDKRPKPSLAVKTPAGKRAVTVMIDSLAAVGGLLNAGDSVDVIAHLAIPDVQTKDKSNTVTAMIFQKLKVLAVNTNLDQPGAYDDQQAAATLKVTFAVDPQEAGLLAFADKNGKLELALRPVNEADRQMVKASTWKTLADYVLENQGVDINNADDEDVTEIKPIENKQNIQIFRGGKEL